MTITNGTRIDSIDMAPTGGYVPGVCNIGPTEIARRRRGAIAGTIATVAIYALVVAFGAPRPLRLVVALPAAGAAVSWLQVTLRFCVAFGARGIYNFGALPDRDVVGDVEAHRADLRRTRAMIGAGVAIGAIAGIVAALIP